MLRRSVRFADARRRRTSPAFHIRLKCDRSWPTSSENRGQNKRGLIVDVGVDTAGRAASSYDCQNQIPGLTGVHPDKAVPVRNVISDLQGLSEVRSLSSPHFF